MTKTPTRSELHVLNPSCDRHLTHVADEDSHPWFMPYLTGNTMLTILTLLGISREPQDLAVVMGIHDVSLFLFAVCHFSLHIDVSNHSMVTKYFTW